MSLTHREEEIVKIVTPLALDAVEEEIQEKGLELSKQEKAIEVAETMDDIIDDLENQNLNVPCDGGYCRICGMCAF